MPSLQLNVYQAAVLGLIMLSAGPTAALAHEVPSTDEKDFMTEPMQRAPFDDFVFRFEEIDEGGKGNGDLRNNFVNTNPVLGTLPDLGVGQNLVTVGACAVNQPHNHPRGTEISFITKGKLSFGFLEENGGRFISANMTQGQSISIPQGLIHFAQNFECETGQFLATFPNRDPGTVTTASNFFRLPLATLRATLGLDNRTIKRVAQAAIASMNPSIDPECAKRCGIHY